MQSLGHVEWPFELGERQRARNPISGGRRSITGLILKLRKSM